MAAAREHVDGSGGSTTTAAAQENSGGLMRTTVFLSFVYKVGTDARTCPAPVFPSIACNWHRRLQWWERERDPLQLSALQWCP